MTENGKPMLVRLTKDIQDPSGDSDLFVKKGTICVAVEVVDDLLLVRAPDGSEFPVEYEDWVEVKHHGKR